jgi:hypothetical protein
MRSVPPRGSGWVVVPKQGSLDKTKYSLGVMIAPSRTHPLPRGGTDLIAASAFLYSNTRTEHYWNIDRLRPA